MAGPVAVPALVFSNSVTTISLGLALPGKRAFGTIEAVLFAGGQLVVEEVLALQQLRAEGLFEAQTQRRTTSWGSRVAVWSVRLVAGLPRIFAAVGRGASGRLAATLCRGGSELDRVDPLQQFGNMHAMTSSIAARHRR